MPASTPDTHQKALSVNLDDRIYGVIAEIGAAQEVARWFFRVGAAAGSVAKTMSAYDMQVSDEIYGKAGRYVSRERLEAMLDREYMQLVRRLHEHRGHDTRFFAFCNTVAARNFAGTNECHGWVGLRFQTEPGGEPNSIVLHINMLDDNAVAQQEAVGVLGVNLIWGVFFGPDDREKKLASLLDNLGPTRLEVDLVHVDGPAFSDLNSAHVGMVMVSRGLAPAVLLGKDGQQHPPTEMFRKRPAVIKRTSIRYSSAIDSAAFAAADQWLEAEKGQLDKDPLNITEFSISNVYAVGSSDPDSHLRHFLALVAQNEWVMLTRLRQNYKLAGYLRRYSEQPIRFVMGVSTFAMLLAQQFYVDSGGGVLEATGKLFVDDVKLYVQPMSRSAFENHLISADVDTDWVDIRSEGDIVTPNSLEFSGPTRLLHQYLLESGWVVELAVTP
ncbi:MAG: TonB-dependent receptor [Gammaproteobacteria bacterium]|nr:TonB-dependent receptor [Gammaproteobacteria bacterium]